MPPISLSKLARNFVRSFFAIGPNAQNFVVRNGLLRWANSFPFEFFQLLDYIRGSFSIGDAKTAFHFEGQLNNNFSRAPISFQILNCITRVTRRLDDD